MNTRSIHLVPSHDRDYATNEGTVVVGLEGLQVPSGRPGGDAFLADVADASFEDVFRESYTQIRRGFEDHAARPGVLAVAAVPGFGVRGRMWLSATEGLRSGVVGRHAHADLFLPDDPGLSLRHLAVLVRKRAGGVRIRVLDLRTRAGFRDEAGRDLRSLAADGPVFLRSGAHRIFLLPTGPGWAPAASAAEAWNALPPRVFTDERTGPERTSPPAHVGRGADLERARREPTVVTALPPIAPPEFRDLVAPGEQTLGHLTVETGRGRSILSLGPSRASTGVLLGRYERCDGVCPAEWFSNGVSRVHAFLLLEDGALHVVDAGSTNGTVLSGQRVHCAPLPAGVPAFLADAAVTWQPAN